MSLKEEAVALYKSGFTLREVAHEVGRSHEWVRQALRYAGEETRERGRVPQERNECPRCGHLTPHKGMVYCSLACLRMDQREETREKIEKALRVLYAGGTYEEAARASGYASKWGVWARLYQFGYLKKVDMPPLRKVDGFVGESGG